MRKKLNKGFEAEFNKHRLSSPIKLGNAMFRYALKRQQKKDPHLSMRRSCDRSDLCLHAHSWCTVQLCAYHQTHQRKLRADRLAAIVFGLSQQLSSDFDKYVVNTALREFRQQIAVRDKD